MGARNADVSVASSPTTTTLNDPINAMVAGWPSFCTELRRILLRRHLRNKQ
jgi:hypothetical protein